MTQLPSRRAFLAGAATMTGAAWAGWRGLDGGSPMLLTGATPRGVDRIVPSGPEHWVGDGFLVHGMLSPSGPAASQSPFLLLDHASRRRFDPSPKPRGVREHPHRGFETVTFAYRGEIAHRDSSGGGGLIGAGDVQWMTAASGVVHEEMFSRTFNERGGDMEMVQLWVNLPRSQKMTTPGYQALVDKDFPRLDLRAARARLIAGELGDERGPARTHTPITLLDLTFSKTGSVDVQLPDGFNTLAFTLEGEVGLGPDAGRARTGDLGFMARGAGPVRITADEGARVLVLAGAPIDEPVAAYGPFVMNTREELAQAFDDYRSGKMGHLM